VILGWLQLLLLLLVSVLVVKFTCAEFLYYYYYYYYYCLRCHFTRVCFGASYLPLFVSDATNLSTVVTLRAPISTKISVLLNLPIIVPCRCFILIVCEVGALKTPRKLT